MVDAVQKEEQYQISDDYHFDPDDYLVTILYRAISNEQDVKISLKTGDNIVVVPAKGEYLIFVENAEKFFTAESSAYEVTVLSQDEVEGYFKNTLGQNIDELMWRASCYASQGKLIKGCEREDVVELRYWPNLTRLPGPSGAISIAALLTRYPTSITLASHLLKMPMEDMFSFYSAAYSAGWVVLHNRTIEAPKLKPHRDNTMLSKLLDKISGL